MNDFMSFLFLMFQSCLILNIILMMMMMIDITWWFNKSIGWWQKFIISNIDSVLCKAELLEFLKSLGHECENKILFGPWYFWRHNDHKHTNRPYFMNLSQQVLVIPTITTICEGGFFKLNDIIIIFYHVWKWTHLMLLCMCHYGGLKLTIWTKDKFSHLA